MLQETRGSGAAMRLAGRPAGGGGAVAPDQRRAPTTPGSNGLIAFWYRIT